MFKQEHQELDSQCFMSNIIIIIINNNDYPPKSKMRKFSSNLITYNGCHSFINTDNEINQKKEEKKSVYQIESNQIKSNKKDQIIHIRQSVNHHHHQQQQHSIDSCDKVIHIFFSPGFTDEQMMMKMMMTMKKFFHQKNEKKTKRKFLLKIKLTVEIIIAIQTYTHTHRRLDLFRIENCCC